MVICFSMPVLAAEKPDDFDAVIVLTRQDAGMDWWFAVPAQFAPVISKVDNVSRGENFNIIIFFNSYGADKDQMVDITYDFRMIRPDGTTGGREENCIGYRGKSIGPYLIPAKDIMTACFDQGDALGEYTLSVTAYDHVRNQVSKKSAKIRLKEFILPVVKQENEDNWFFEYPVNPQPSKAMAFFLNTPCPYINEKGEVLWSALWFYKCIYENNDFLVPCTVKYFKDKATLQQKKDIILLFRLLKQTDKLPMTVELKEYNRSLGKIAVPDPYTEITTADKLDMLWGEFFATGKIKPVRQIVTSFNLCKYSGTGEDVMKEAVFQSALWSVRSNCEQMPLLFQYCACLYETGDLNKDEKDYLGIILKKVVECKTNPK